MNVSKSDLRLSASIGGSGILRATLASLAVQSNDLLALYTPVNSFRL